MVFNCAKNVNVNFHQDILKLHFDCGSGYFVFFLKNISQVSYRFNVFIAPVRAKIWVSFKYKAKGFSQTTNIYFWNQSNYSFDSIFVSIFNTTVMFRLKF